jgi:hypothetical protein
MSIGVYIILILFGLFVVLLVTNPNMSCFGKKVRAPFYPLTRKRRKASRTVKTTDFGFHLGPDGAPAARPQATPAGTRPAGSKPAGSSPDAPKAEDYGFHLD